jgi:hypothetical protein
MFWEAPANHVITSYLILPTLEKREREASVCSSSSRISKEIEDEEMQF